MDWTYYREGFGNGDWRLFREGANYQAQIFNFKKGWVDYVGFFDRIIKGEIDSSDIVTEEEARCLVQSLPDSPSW